MRPVEAGLQSERPCLKMTSLSPQSRKENHKKKIRGKYVTISSWRIAGILKG